MFQSQPRHHELTSSIWTQITLPFCHTLLDVEIMPLPFPVQFFRLFTISLLPPGKTESTVFLPLRNPLCEPNLLLQFIECTNLSVPILSMILQITVAFGVNDSFPLALELGRQRRIPCFSTHYLQVPIFLLTLAHQSLEYLVIHIIRAVSPTFLGR